MQPAARADCRNFAGKNTKMQKQSKGMRRTTRPSTMTLAASWALLVGARRREAWPAGGSTGVDACGSPGLVRGFATAACTSLLAVR